MKKLTPVLFFLTLLYHHAAAQQRVVLSGFITDWRKFSEAFHAGRNLCQFNLAVFNCTPNQSPKRIKKRFQHE
ncbi:MAG: hypothetical protein LH606_09780 [Cytophagaceae bacterium]|nr:hypothetical protein [Cytophagaceae bacterium]